MMQTWFMPTATKSNDDSNDEEEKWLSDDDKHAIQTLLKADK